MPTISYKRKYKKLAFVVFWVSSTRCCFVTEFFSFNYISFIYLFIYYYFFAALIYCAEWKPSEAFETVSCSNLAERQRFRVLYRWQEINCKYRIVVCAKLTHLRKRIREWTGPGKKSFMINSPAAKNKQQNIVSLPSIVCPWANNSNLSQIRVIALPIYEMPWTKCLLSPLEGIWEQISTFK